MDKERRDKLRCDLSSPNCEACDMPGRTEVLALLDMADERDELKNVIFRLSEQRYCYRDLLESAEAALRNAELDAMADRIEAALEGKNNG